jgi:hypothetical protein
MTPDDPRHGTYAGYQRHRKDDEDACAPCRAANNEYTRKIRSDPAALKRDREVSRAGSRAAWRTVDAHRADYERFYAEELTALRRDTR